MAQQSTVDSLLQRNKEYATTHQAPPLLANADPRIRPVLVVSCADFRVIPEYYLKIQPQDAVVVIRNAGGHVEPDLNSILAIDHLVKFSDVVIVHHTDCGTTHFKDANIRAELKDRAPGNDGVIDKMEFGQIDDLEQSVRDDIAVLTSSPFVRAELKERVSGFVYDLETGVLSAVEH